MALGPSHGGGGLVTSTARPVEPWADGNRLGVGSGMDRPGTGQRPAANRPTLLVSFRQVRGRVHMPAVNGPRGIRQGKPWRACGQEVDLALCGHSGIPAKRAFPTPPLGCHSLIRWATSIVAEACRKPCAKPLADRDCAQNRAENPARCEGAARGEHVDEKWTWACGAR